MSLKTEIIKLRNEGKTYLQISKVLKCAKSTISYHCQNLDRNKEIALNNRLSNSENWLRIQCWSDNVKRTVSQLYFLRTRMTEIAEILNEEISTIRFFCTNKPQIDSSNFKSYKYVKLRRLKLKLLCAIFKGGKCAKCGYSACIAALDFHHKNSDNKGFAISNKSGSSWKTIKKEVEKCVLLCSNCHREEHFTNEFKDLFIL